MLTGWQKISRREGKVEAVTDNVKNIFNYFISNEWNSRLSGGEYSTQECKKPRGEQRRNVGKK